MFITDHKLIIAIIFKSENICIPVHCIYRKSFSPAYSQLDMLGACRHTNRLQQYLTEQTNTSTSLGMVDPEIIAVNRNGRTFSTHVQHKHTLVMTNQSAASSVQSKTTRKMMPPTVIYILSL